jgi:hypothetical protein
MRTAFLLILAIALPSSVAAQDASPQGDPSARPRIGGFVVDVRGAFPKLAQDESVASGIGVTRANLPTRALGLVFGAHVYPLGGKSVALGIGGEFLMSGRGRTLEPTTEGGPAGPTVNARFSAISPQVSLNFGGRDGWSYLSGGMGWGRYTAERAEAPLSGSAPRARSINYGGGARWFTNKHVAISMDLRFYRVDATGGSGTRPATPKVKSMTMSAGIALR